MMYINYSRYPSPIGVRKKIRAQTKTFANYFGSAMRVDCAYGIVYLYKNEEIVEKDFAVTDEDVFHVCLLWIKKYGITKVYIRCRL
ncbi:MAG: hypothetical protein K6G18_04190, partial [Treponema sp.]|nr:hypothetical protein [Treponema sp.]